MNEERSSFSSRVSTHLLQDNVRMGLTLGANDLRALFSKVRNEVILSSLILKRIGVWNCGKSDNLNCKVMQ